MASRRQEHSPILWSDGLWAGRGTDFLKNFKSFATAFGGLGESDEGEDIMVKTGLGRTPIRTSAKPRQRLPCNSGVMHLIRFAANGGLGPSGVRSSHLQVEAEGVTVMFSATTDETEFKELEGAEAEPGGRITSVATVVLGRAVTLLFLQWAFQGIPKSKKARCGLGGDCVDIGGNKLLQCEPTRHQTCIRAVHWTAKSRDGSLTTMYGTQARVNINCCAFERLNTVFRLE
ncbi:hypothetical protein K438DRAFT_1778772 [Mycena galopus ATCC 62051]|nr:hypothetical protein K438DRAFT_1778772 [Mycena galopus ATCC 62051]